METFFTADTHFHHANIIKYCNRPFATVEEMDDEIIKRWNSVVSGIDTIYHLGDFMFTKSYDRSVIVPFLDRLNFGYLILIKGNHDDTRTSNIYKQEFGIPTYDYLEIKGLHSLPVVLSHYPFESWNRSFHGSIHLHGHTHGTIPTKQNRYDVGVDVWNYIPVTLEQILGK